MTTRFKPSRCPMRTFFVVAYAAFLTSTAVDVSLAVSGGETTGREVVVIAAVGMAAVVVIGAAWWWVRRTLDRQSREFLARLDGAVVRGQR